MSRRRRLSSIRRKPAATALTLVCGGVLLVGVTVSLAGLAMLAFASFFWLVPALATNPAPIGFSAAVGLQVTIGGAVVSLLAAVPLLVRAGREDRENP